MRPLIGITGRQFAYGDVSGSPELLAESMIDMVLVDYVDAVLAAGGLPVHLPMSVDPAEILPRLDGIVLTGGADLDPAHYGQEPDANLGSIEPDRDCFELAVASIAIDRSMPTVGVCRGQQVLNVAAGGTLVQHLPSHARYDEAPDSKVHNVTLEAGSIAASAYGPSISVNSFHHQVIDQLGHGVRTTGRADDGEIEAIEFDGKPIVGVQWHPEMYRRQDPIFKWLVREADALTRSVESDAR